MKTRSSFGLIVIVSLLLSSCAAASPAPEAERLNANNAPAEEAPFYDEEPAAEEAQPMEYEAVQATSVPLNNPSAAEESRPMPTQAATGDVVMDHGNEFQDFGLNEYENTRNDHLSTFALDVDTASYSMTRRYINEGNLPPAEAIRVEEFVNAFDAGYEAPRKSAFALYADGAPSPFEDDGTYLIRFGVKGYEVPDYARKPLVLTFVIDVSGSMKMDNRLDLVKDSLELLVDQLDRFDSVAIVVYGSRSYTVLEPTRGDDYNTIMRAINKLKSGGSTNVEDGLRIGYKEAMHAYDQDATNRVILCSDGVANTGETAWNALLNDIHGYVDQGITMTSMGFGMGNYNDVLMEQLADNGNGNYYYIDTLDESKELFVENLTSTLQVIAMDAKIQIDFNPDVVSYYRLIGYENRDIADEDFRDNAVDAGEIGAGHSAVAIYAVHFDAYAEGRIATMQMRWEDPDTHEVVEISGDLNTRDMLDRYEDANEYYQLAVTVMQFAEVLRESPWGQETSLRMISNYAEDAASTIRTEEVEEFAELVWQAARIR
ncbi:MAG: von Willebrand factor type A domain-containing protein [Anaerolineaceae bacterium]|nr:von Willebrand factor type A domain-containing protein [Anaerolineaceae bacterium]